MHDGRQQLLLLDVALHPQTVGTIRDGTIRDGTIRAGTIRTGQLGMGPLGQDN